MHQQQNIGKGLNVYYCANKTATNIFMVFKLRCHC